MWPWTHYSRQKLWVLNLLMSRSEMRCKDLDRQPEFIVEYLTVSGGDWPNFLVRSPSRRRNAELLLQTNKQEYFTPSLFLPLKNFVLTCMIIYLNYCRWQVPHRPHDQNHSLDRCQRDQSGNPRREWNWGWDGIILQEPVPYTRSLCFRIQDGWCGAWWKWLGM